jgi:hypothetical protein
MVFIYVQTMNESKQEQMIFTVHKWDQMLLWYPLFNNFSSFNEKWQRNDWEMTKKWLRNDWEMTEKWLRNDWEMTEKW